MAITDLITGLAGALAKTRAELAQVDGEISQLQHERQSTELAPPHTDDIVAALKRGLSAATRSFEDRLAWNLNDANAKNADAAKAVKGTAQLLMINAERPASGTTLHGPVGAVRGGLFPVSGLGAQQGVLDAAALTYFLRDRIEAEIPALVKKLCPSAEKGMKQADRDGIIRDLDLRIVALKERRTELMGHISHARKVSGTVIG